MPDYRPEHFNTVSVYLIVRDPKAAIEFYEKAFGGEGGSCLSAPDGSVLHAEVRIGDSTIMLSGENDQWGMKSPDGFGGSPASMMLYVEDCDAAFAKATDAGATEVSPPGDQFWGDRHAKVRDPFGFEWGLATKIEDLTLEEVQQRGAAWLEQVSKGG